MFKCVTNTMMYDRAIWYRGRIFPHENTSKVFIQFFANLIIPMYHLAINFQWANRAKRNFVPGVSKITFKLSLNLTTYQAP